LIEGEARMQRAWCLQKVLVLLWGNKTDKKELLYKTITPNNIHVDVSVNQIM
jgi:hypothetical protein